MDRNFPDPVCERTDLGGLERRVLEESFASPEIFENKSFEISGTHLVDGRRAPSGGKLCSVMAAFDLIPHGEVDDCRAESVIGGGVESSLSSTVRSITFSWDALIILLVSKTTI